MESCSATKLRALKYMLNYHSIVHIIYSMPGKLWLFQLTTELGKKNILDVFKDTYYTVVD